MAGRMSQRLQLILEAKDNSAGIQQKYLKRLEQTRGAYQALEKEIKNNQGLSEKQKGTYSSLAKSMRTNEALTRKTMTSEKKRGQILNQMRPLYAKIAAAQEKLASGSGLGRGGRSGFTEKVIKPLQRELSKLTVTYHTVTEVRDRDKRSLDKHTRALRTQSQTILDNTNQTNKNSSSNNQNTNSNRKNKESIDKLDKSMDKFNQRVTTATGSMRRRLGALRNQILVLVFAFGAFARALSSAFEESRKTEAALVGLSSVAMNLGMSIDDSNRAAMSLATDGLLTIQEAAAGLKNLLAAGFGMPQAIQMMNVFKDAAAFNRQGTLSMGEAIVGATQGVKNMNSIMIDNAGITKNLSVMYKEYAASIGTSAGKLTDLEKRQAAYEGIVKEGAVFSGDAAKSLDTVQGKMAQLSAATRDAKIAFGDAMMPAVESVLEVIGDLVSQFGEWVNANDKLLKQGLASWGKNIANIFGAIGNILSVIGPLFVRLTNLVGGWFTAMIASKIVLGIWTKISLGTKKLTADLATLSVTATQTGRSFRFISADGKRTYGMFTLLSAAVTGNIAVFTTLTRRMILSIGAMRRQALEAKKTAGAYSFVALKLKGLILMQRIFIGQMRKLRLTMTQTAKATGFFAKALGAARIGIIGVKVALTALAARILPLLLLMLAFEALFWVFNKIGEALGMAAKRAESLQEMANSMYELRIQTDKVMESWTKLDVVSAKFGMDMSGMIEEQIVLLRNYEAQMAKVQTAINDEWWYSDKDAEKYTAIKEKIQSQYDVQLNIAMEYYKEQESELRAHMERLNTLHKTMADADVLIYESTQSSKLNKLYKNYKEMKNAQNAFFMEFTEDEITKNEHLMNIYEKFGRRWVQIEKMIMQELKEERQKLYDDLEKIAAAGARGVGGIAIKGDALSEYNNEIAMKKEMFKLDTKVTEQEKIHNDVIDRRAILIEDLKYAYNDLGATLGVMDNTADNMVSSFTRITDALNINAMADFSLAITQNQDIVTKVVDGYLLNLKKFIDANEDAQGFLDPSLLVEFEAKYGEQWTAIIDSQREGLLEVADNWAGSTSEFGQSAYSQIMAMVNALDVVKGRLSELPGLYKQGLVEINDVQHTLMEVDGLLEHEAEKLKLIYMEYKIQGHQLQLKLDLQKSLMDMAREQAQQEDRVYRIQSMQFALVQTYSSKYLANELKITDQHNTQIRSISNRNAQVYNSIGLIQNRLSIMEKEEVLTEEMRAEYDIIIGQMQQEMYYNSQKASDLKFIYQQQVLMNALEQDHIHNLDMINKAYEEQGALAQIQYKHNSEIANMIGNDQYIQLLKFSNASSNLTNEFEKQASLLLQQVAFQDVLLEMTTDPLAIRSILQKKISLIDELGILQQIHQVQSSNLAIMQIISTLQGEVSRKYEETNTVLRAQQTLYDGLVAVNRVMSGILDDTSSIMSRMFIDEYNALTNNHQIRQSGLMEQIEKLQIIAQVDRDKTVWANMQIKLLFRQMEIEDAILENKIKTMSIQSQIAYIQAMTTKEYKEQKELTSRQKAIAEHRFNMEMKYYKAFGASRAAEDLEIDKKINNLHIEKQLKLDLATIEKKHIQSVIDAKTKDKSITESELEIYKLRISELDGSLLTTANYYQLLVNQLVKEKEITEEIRKRKDALVLLGHTTTLNATNDMFLAEQIRDSFRIEGVFDSGFLDATLGAFNDFGAKILESWGVVTAGSTQIWKAYITEFERISNSAAQAEVDRAQGIYDNDKSQENSGILDNAKRNLEQQTKITDQRVAELEVQRKQELMQAKYNAALNITTGIVGAITAAMNRKYESERKAANEEHRLNEQRRLGLIDEGQYQKKLEYNRKKVQIQKKLDEYKAHQAMVQNAMEMIGLELIKGGISKLVNFWPGDDAQGWMLLAAGVALSAAGASIAQSIYGSKIQEEEQKLITLEEEMNAYEQGPGPNQAREGRRSFGGTVRAEQLTVNITPTMVISGEQVFIGSGSVQEFSDVIASNMIGNIQQSIETGELDFSSVGNSSDNTSTSGS